MRESIIEENILTSKKVFFIFLDIEDDSASNLNFRHQVKVSKNKESFAILFVGTPHHLLKNQQIIIILSTSGSLLNGTGLDGVIGLEIAVSQIKYVIVDLDDEHGEVDLCELMVEMLQLVGVVCGLLYLRGLIH